ncbi:MAG TPA: DMT family transporter, partial [Bacteroidota bacterium]|nr:DMT family transporter [Bacteroidota bacterium]
TLLLVQTRVTFSVVIMACILALVRPALLRIRARDLWRMALLGIVAIAGANYTYYVVIGEASVAVAILLQYTAPFFVMAYAAITREEEVTVAKLVAAGLAIAGCYFAVGGSVAASGLPPGALAIGLLSAVCFSFLTIFTRHLLVRYSIWTVTFYGFAFASLFWLVVNPPWVIARQPPDTGTWVALVGLAVISVLLPYSLFFGGLRHVVSSRAIIISTLEPITAIVTAALIAGESFSLPQAFGAALVIGAIVLLQIKHERGGEELTEEPHGRE